MSCVVSEGSIDQQAEDEAHILPYWQIDAIKWLLASILEISSMGDISDTKRSDPFKAFHSSFACVPSPLLDPCDSSTLR